MSKSNGGTKNMKSGNADKSNHSEDILSFIKKGELSDVVDAIIFEDIGENELMAIVGNKIKINTSRMIVQTYGKDVYNIPKDIVSAIANLKEGEFLTKQQEYAIHTLVHECLHSKQPFDMMNHHKTKEQVKALELSTEFVAVCKYEKVMMKYGQSSHYVDNTWKMSSYGAEELRDRLVHAGAHVPSVSAQLEKAFNEIKNPKTYKSKVFQILESNGLSKKSIEDIFKNYV